MPIQDGFENGDHGIIVKLVDSDGVEVTQEAGGDGVTTSACALSNHMHDNTYVTTKFTSDSVQCQVKNISAHYSHCIKPTEKNHHNI